MDSVIENGLGENGFIHPPPDTLEWIRLGSVERLEVHQGAGPEAVIRVGERALGAEPEVDLAPHRVHLEAPPVGPIGGLLSPQVAGWSLGAPVREVAVERNFRLPGVRLDRPVVEWFGDHHLVQSQDHGPGRSVHQSDLHQVTRYILQLAHSVLPEADGHVQIPFQLASVDHLDLTAVPVVAQPAFDDAGPVFLVDGLEGLTHPARFQSGLFADPPTEQRVFHHVDQPAAAPRRHRHRVVNLIQPGIPAGQPGVELFHAVEPHGLGPDGFRVASEQRADPSEPRGLVGVDRAHPSTLQQHLVLHRSEGGIAARGQAVPRVSFAQKLVEAVALLGDRSVNPVTHVCLRCAPCGRLEKVRCTGFRN